MERVATKEENERESERELCIMEIFLKTRRRVTVDDEQGLAALVHVGQIACENPEKLLEENRTDSRGGKGNCQSNCPRHGTRQLR